jgi:hypothetical protein
VKVGTVNQSAIGGSDFTPLNVTLTFEPGGPLKQLVTVQTTEDAFHEQDEVFFVRLSEPSQQAVLGTPSQIATTIRDDDPLQTVVISVIQNATESLLRNDESLGRLYFTRSGSDLSNSLSVWYTVDQNTSTAGQADVQRYVGSYQDAVTFLPGQSEVYLDVWAYLDGLEEGTEHLDFRFSNGLGYVISGERNKRLFINDNAEPLPQFTVQALASVYEGGAPSIVVVRSAKTSGRKGSYASNRSSRLVGVLCTLETCNSFQLVPGDKRPRFISKPRQQRVLYYCFLDRQLGLIHVRLQTWAPFTLQVYVNGHEWLAQQLLRLGIGFVQQHNAFTQLDDPVKAQRQADRFAKLNWPVILNRYAHQVNPLLHQDLGHYRVRWFVDQAEFATDLLFKTPSALAGLYQKLLQFATVTFTPKDILGFLGRKWDRRFDGDVESQVKTDRLLGTRIKHRMTINWLNTTSSAAFCGWKP